MSLLLNDPGCAINSGNTGIPGCRFDPGLIVSAILVDKDTTFTLSTAAAFISAIQTASKAARASRAFPIHGFIEMADGSTEPTEKEWGYGSKEMTSEGKYIWTFTLGKGGHSYLQALRKFNKDQDKRVLFIDANNVVMGYKTGAATFKGFTLDSLYGKPFKVAQDKDNPAMYYITFSLRNPQELNDDLAFFDMGADPESSFQGLLDIEMHNIGAGSATKKHIIGVRSVLDKVALYDAYSATIVTSFASIFTATKAGVAANPIACVAVPGSKGFELEFAATGDHVITMANAAALAALNIGAGADIGFDVETAGTLTVSVA